MIHPATPNDAPELATFIIMAMGTLANSFVNGRGQHEALLLFERFAAIPGNQYSFQNCLVYSDHEGVKGMICAYNGAKLNQLRQPFLVYIQQQYGFNGIPEDETKEGEYYVDCIGVKPTMRGKGIGKQLIKGLIEQGRTNNWPAIGLLVVKTNHQAQKLYTSLGFKIKGEKKLLGTDNWHMQYNFPKTQS
ncbi:GNAT family N-acetyltransferase [Mucilaginibacter terrae]|uniref:Ribosomal protein S18 acetylase RimI-like enzyme n=1 Tax=Mucilaginibacter terrae TaxID=1955052 RepID=A0ABU3GQM3_9SPHI|nr:N-acetyltransferase [Mucilaginibacter terrae]MDT3400955.1 ribosomal protein S18 acetylase RimI-like enzyme [Mucilaginibacter terrae]